MIPPTKISFPLLQNTKNINLPRQTEKSPLNHPTKQHRQQPSSTLTTHHPKMKFTSTLAALCSIASAVSAAPVVIGGTEYPEGTTVDVYPDGLPSTLIPRALAAEGSNLEKRANAGVYLCNDRNFQGYCVHIVAPMYQCGRLSSFSLFPHSVPVLSLARRRSK